MRDAGKVVVEALAIIEEVIKPEITIAELNKLAEEFIIKQGAKPCFKGYCGFPAFICTSVNDEVVHGIPSNRVLLEGDIISIDCIPEILTLN
ncbi:M24 family metallopeptidase [Clostridium estertheticum]|nr:M24 family metallopeptidase [Clostridium estertheticum]WLC87620.1 M24 family metallopeptidase [Clostridium estertheticum]